MLFGSFWVAFASPLTRVCCSHASIPRSFATCSFLGYVDLLGVTYESSTIATGFGGYLAQPILRKYVEGREDELSEAEAIKIIEQCMRVLYYRDARALNKVR